ncbi:Enoyl-CoA hydratase/carnithine racemase [Octadecabacter temperatus]|uniref:Putative enoyl-CoA hydratase echA8 n=1 Tax=Octadecabacter temperatus TaxID=1458307 RepID=A0A0K0Y9E6_9RHOB|nr:enoyl-CoA hydratase/isomerase family protein [Octadecabacter temperatus]AKS47583.1 putative enoyl-CoA hydratase echA8 [Octadecabacter temperatus]SIO40985.1 Enoyl-CoA hydratase/carnithine racemase [Octadecabacter temperatus]
MIDATVSDGALTLKINRPDKANALNEVMLSELADCVERADQPVLVLTGAGKVFSAGADLDDVRGGTLATSTEWERLSSAVASFKGLSVASLNGSCAGGAFGMVLACDLRIAVETAKFFYPVIKMGVLPQPSDPERMRALIGPSATKRILLTGAKVDAPEALSLGLIDQISSADLAVDTIDLIDPALKAHPTQVAAIKALIG